MQIGKKMATVISLILLSLSSNAVYGYDFGTKVGATDSDIGLALFPLGAGIFYWDAGGIPGYDEKDIVYLHTPGPAVNANDVRLNSIGTYTAGSKVTMQDNDIGMPLTLLPGAAIGYLNLYGSGAYDFQDPVYLHRNILTPPPLNRFTILNDIRLTDASIYKAGTNVRNFDQDFNKILSGGPVPLGFFDVNGNGIYDYQDNVYLNIPSGITGHVSVNNVRISQQLSPNDGKPQTNPPKSGSNTTNDEPNGKTTIPGIGGT